METSSEKRLAKWLQKQRWRLRQGDVSVAEGHALSELARQVSPSVWRPELQGAALASILGKLHKK